MKVQEVSVLGENIFLYISQSRSPYSEGVLTFSANTFPRLAYALAGCRWYCLSSLVLYRIVT